MSKLPKENTIWLAVSAALVIGVVFLAAAGISGLGDLPVRPGPPGKGAAIENVGATPQEKAAAITAAATADAAQVTRYNADVGAWATERANKRTSSFALLAGAVALLTAAVGAATHAETVRKNRGDSQSAAEGRADDRFATAIEHLSSKQLGVRIGGIFSLEALAREAEGRIQTVVQVLLAHAESWTDGAKSWSERPDGAEPYPAPSDVRGAFAAAARVRTVDAMPIIDLSYADLGAAEIAAVDLRHADLSNAVLTKADLRFAVLKGANLQCAVLAEAGLDGANLTDADMRQADLTGASLIGTQLSGARLAGTVFWGVELSEVDLIGVDLRGADLVGAHLELADLARTRLDGPELIGATGVGSHSSHETFFAKLIGEHVTVASSVGDDQRGVIQEVEVDPGPQEVFDADLSLGLSLGDDKTKLLWIANSMVRPHVFPF
ncbi:MAG: pentapeptide repeat-containing protein [Solirubrobacteraceae bacterium]|nr:pentapeptide repeat-containing protein [Solirubrobacteraceae bacterium]